MCEYRVNDCPVIVRLLGEAASIAPTRRNLYYVGVNAYLLGEYDRAVTFFQRALKAQCGSPTEVRMCTRAHEARGGGGLPIRGPHCSIP